MHRSGGTSNLLACETKMEVQTMTGSGARMLGWSVLSPKNSLHWGCDSNPARKKFRGFRNLLGDSTYNSSQSAFPVSSILGRIFSNLLIECALRFPTASFITLSESARYSGNSSRTETRRFCRVQLHLSRLCVKRSSTVPHSNKNCQVARAHFPAVPDSNWVIRRDPTSFASHSIRRSTSCCA